MASKILEGKRALITGGASGIGKAIAEKFLKEGAAVYVLDINGTLLKKTVQELSLLGLIRGYVIDITNEIEVVKTLGTIEKEDGLVDTLVNNAGVMRAHPFIGYSKTDWEKVYGVNFTAALFLSREIAKRLVDHHKKGTITFITSVHTAFAFPDDSSYDVSKHALVGLMRSIAVELGPFGIRANAVAPGGVYPTGLTQGLSKDNAKEGAKGVPLRRFATPGEIANIVAFLASDEAGILTGAEIRADGGQSITWNRT